MLQHVQHAQNSNSKHQFDTPIICLHVIIQELHIQEFVHLIMLFVLFRTFFHTFGHYVWFHEHFRRIGICTVVADNAGSCAHQNGCVAWIHVHRCCRWSDIVPCEAEHDSLNLRLLHRIGHRVDKLTFHFAYLQDLMSGVSLELEKSSPESKRKLRCSACVTNKRDLLRQISLYTCYMYNDVHYTKRLRILNTLTFFV